MNTTNTPPIGLRVKRWRKKAKLSQAEVAELAGCSAATIGKMEAGKSQPYRSTIARLEEIMASLPVAGTKPTAPAVTPTASKPAPAPVLQGEETTIQHTIGLGSSGRRRATLILPPDLTRAEAARLSALITALVD